MAWEPLSFTPSSNINALIYDADSQQLMVEFLSGKVFTYNSVNAEMAAGFDGCQSSSRHLEQVIRPQSVYKQIK